MFGASWRGRAGKIAVAQFQRDFPKCKECFLPKELRTVAAARRRMEKEKKGRIKVEFLVPVPGNDEEEMSPVSYEVDLSTESAVLIDANQRAASPTSDGIRQCADGSSKPSM